MVLPSGMESHRPPRPVLFPHVLITHTPGAAVQRGRHLIWRTYAGNTGLSRLAVSLQVAYLLSPECPEKPKGRTPWDRRLVWLLGGGDDASGAARGHGPGRGYDRPRACVPAGPCRAAPLGPAPP